MTSSKTNRWKLGLFVVSGIALAFATLLWLGTAQFRRQSFVGVTYVNESVQGLDVGAPVKFRGVTVGAVSRISVAPDRMHVAIQMSIYVDRLVEIGLEERGEPLPRKQPRPASLRVQIASAGITGIKYVLADYFDPAKYPIPVLPFEPPTDVEYVPSVHSTMKGLEDSVTEVLDALPAALNKVSTMIANLDKTITDADVMNLSKEARDAIRTVRGKVDALDALSLGAKAESVLEEASATLNELKRVAITLEARTQPVQSMLTKVDSLATTLEAAVKDAALGPTAAALRSAGTGVATATQDASALISDLDATVLSLRETAVSLRRLASQLERDPQSLLFGRTPEFPPPVRK